MFDDAADIDPALCRLSTVDQTIEDLQNNLAIILK